MPPATAPRVLAGLAWWVLVTFVAAGIGSLASLQAGEFYGQLRQPGWAPPAAVFGPVWTLLYVLMAVAAWLAWLRAGSFAAARAALVLYLVQLAANALWSWLFFGWHLGGLALMELVLLWLLIGATVMAFWRVRPLAAILLLPYWAWVTFAGFLNHAVWRLNPGLL